MQFLRGGGYKTQKKTVENQIKPKKGDEIYAIVIQPQRVLQTKFRRVIHSTPRNGKKSSFLYT